MPTTLPTRAGTLRTPHRSTRSHLVLVRQPPREPSALLPATQRLVSARTAQAIAEHVLTGIRAIMGLVLVSCGLSGFLQGMSAGVLRQPSPGDAVMFGGVLVLAGSAIPLLKGIEVLLETVVSVLWQRESSSLGSYEHAMGSSGRLRAPRDED